jgi:hypothetical protein
MSRIKIPAISEMMGENEAINIVSHYTGNILLQGLKSSRAQAPVTPRRDLACNRMLLMFHLS